MKDMLVSLESNLIEGMSEEFIQCGGLDEAGQQ
jgi:hypothetical protein